MPDTVMRRAAALRIILLIVPCFLLADCLPAGFQANPVMRTLGWFLYVGGRDIREACANNGNDQIRLIYNAIYAEQVRTYDLVVNPDNNSAELTSRVIVPSSRVQIDWDAPLAPWNGVVKRTSIDRTDVGRLTVALKRSGYFETAPVGLRLRSDNFYWVVSGCEDGKFHLNAFQAPTKRFERIEFPPVLFGLDMTDVPVNPVRQLTFGASDPTLSSDRSGATGTGFILQVAEGENLL